MALSELKMNALSLNLQDNQLDDKDLQNLIEKIRSELRSRGVSFVQDTAIPVPCVVIVSRAF